MTTAVRITAHCSKDKEVLVHVIVDGAISTNESVVLQDGEVIELYAYDNRSITVAERAKA